MIAWIQRTLSDKWGQPSTKRHIIAASAASLCLVFVALGIAASAWAWRNGDIGGGVVAALTFLGGILAGLAGHAYRKPEVGAVAPSAPGGESVAEPTGCVSAADRGTP